MIKYPRGEFMKKWRVVLIISILLLSGCQSKNSNELDSRKLDVYKSNIETLQEVNPIAATSDKFIVSSEMSTLADGTHRYYIIIDNANESMYNVQLMALEVGVDANFVMAPSIGILDDETYNLISKDSPVKDGYVKGLVLSGDTTSNPIDVKLMISWTDKSNTKKQEEFLLLHIDTMSSNGD